MLTVAQWKLTGTSSCSFKSQSGFDTAQKASLMVTYALMSCSPHSIPKEVGGDLMKDREKESHVSVEACQDARKP